MNLYKHCRGTPRTIVWKTRELKPKKKVYNMFPAGWMVIFCEDAFFFASIFSSATLTNSLILALAQLHCGWD